MINNYLKIAWRNLKKQPFFTFLNITGLTVGVTGVILIGLYIRDEFSYDTMFKDASHIYRINANVKFGGGNENLAECSSPVAETLLKDFPHVEATTRLRNWGVWMFRREDKVDNIKESNIIFADYNFFDFFGIRFLEGDAATALKEPHTLVITTSVAQKHFGNESALNKILMVNDQTSYKVTGVIDDLPRNSFLQNRTVFVTMEDNEESKEGKWGNFNFPTYVRLKDGSDTDDLQTALNTLLGKYIIPWAQNIYPGITEEQFIASGNAVNFSPMPITDVHLYSKQSPELSPVSDIKNIYILGAIGLFLILLASINFMNLSTAYSLKRSKEVGIRKALGSEKKSLIGQFLTESVLITSFAVGFSVLLAALLLPFFNELADKQMSFPIADFKFWLSIFGFTLILGIFSGSYPAFFISGFIPVKVLKGSGEKSLGGGKVRNGLVVFQFATSVFLIVSTLVVFRQLNYIKSKDLGFEKEQILVIDDIYSLEEKRQTLKSEVKQFPFVQTASLSSYLPTPSARSSGTLMIEGKTNQEDAINAQQWEVDFDYISTLGLEMVAGRAFDPAFASDSTAMVVNESTLKLMGLDAESAIGVRMVNEFNENAAAFYTIVGVVKDFHYQSLRDHIGALTMTIARDPGSLLVKLKPGQFEQGIQQIKGVWQNLAVGQPFNYYFLDDAFNNSYRAEQRLGKIFVVFTILSLIIACLGLFGLAAFNAEKRIKEIGVRKVLGASVGQIVTTLSLDFMKLVFVSVLIAAPLSWYAMSKWLEGFTYRTSISIWVFGIAAGVALLISLATVSFQSIKAAVVNPVKSLRSE